MNTASKLYILDQYQELQFVMPDLGQNLIKIPAQSTGKDRRFPLIHME